MWIHGVWPFWPLTLLDLSHIWGCEIIWSALQQWHPAQEQSSEILHHRDSGWLENAKRPWFALGVATIFVSCAENNPYFNLSIVISTGGGAICIYIYIIYIIQYIGCLGDMYSKLIPISYLSHWFGTTVLLSSFAPGTSSARPHPYNSAGLLVLWGPWDG